MAANNLAATTSLERLSSGLRINRAADDATGLSIADRLGTQVRGSQQAARNIQDGISLLNTADGAAGDLTALAQRMRLLAVQAANGALTTSDRADAEAEFGQLQNEITSISTQTSFNGIYVFLGAAGSIVTSAARSTSASSPSDTSTVGAQVNATIASLPIVAGQRILTLPSPADQYGLGAPGPASIVVTLTNSVTLATVNIPYGAGGFTYNPATQEISGSAATPPGFDLVTANYVKQGSLTNIPLSGTPIAGSEAVTANGVPIAAGGPNGFTVAGNSLTINGNGRPTATFPLSINAGYTQTGTTTLTLNTTNPFTGNGATSLNGLTFSVNGSPVTLTTPADYTLSQSQVAQVGNSPLYSYSVTVNNASIAAAAGPGQSTIAANYTVSYPTINGPYNLIVQKGANHGDTQQIDLPPVTLGTLNLQSDDISTQGGAMTALTDLDAAIDQIDSARGLYGASTNRLTYALNDVTSNTEDQAAAESQIRDTDVAQETSTLTRKQILLQASVQALQIAQTSPQSVLRLLQ